MNTFGTTQTQVPLRDPRDARQNRMRFQRDPVRELAYANSLYVPGGRYPARGWILLTRADYDLVRGYDTDYTLTFTDRGTSLTFGHLSIVQARCVTRGLASDPGALYLVELTDKRGILWNRFFQYPTDSYYNILSPAYPNSFYLQSGFNGTNTPHTWDTMIRDLWEQMTVLGTFPGLAYAVTGTPMNWDPSGTSAWETLSDMLHQIGMQVSVNLNNATQPYGIVGLGNPDGTFQTLHDNAVKDGRLQDDLEWIDSGAGRVPGLVVVYFRRVNQYFGTEETVRRDTLQWATNSVYSVNVGAPAAFAGATGTHYLWDDFAIRYDANGSPLAADTAAAAAIASQRVAQYYDNIYWETAGYLNRTYAGVLPFYTGSLCNGVCWRQDFRYRLSFQTNVIRGDLWREVLP